MGTTLSTIAGLPHEAVWRHPFPGPGLGVRLLCSTGREDRAGFDAMEPALATLAARTGLALLALPIRSVGVKSDVRAYEHPVLVSGDAPWDDLLQLAGGEWIRQHQTLLITGPTGTNVMDVQIIIVDC